MSTENDRDVREKRYDKRDLEDAFRAGWSFGDAQWTHKPRPNFADWFTATFPPVSSGVDQ